MLVKTRTPSDYQARIIDFSINGSGDAFIDAVAGSGKTTTLEMVAEELGAIGTKALFLAFNKHIANELKKRLQPLGHNVSTIHGIGYGCVKKFLGSTPIQIIDRKYQEIIREVVREVAQFEREQEQTICSVAQEIFKFSRSSLIDLKDSTAVDEVIKHYGIDVEDQFTKDFCLAILPEVGKRGEFLAKNNGVISYCDMLWLPHAFNLTPWQYGYVLVDEAQDLSPAQLELALKCRRARGRMIFVGDEYQAIYGFAGSDTQSVKQIVRRTNAVRLPLSVCYRCPKSHIELAKGIVSQIEAAQNAEEGVIKNIKREKLSSMVRVNDLILCRTTSPLVSAAFELIGVGIPAKIKGKDIGRGLIALMKKVIKNAENNGRQVRIDSFISEMYEFERKMISSISEESQSQRLADQCSSLNAIFNFAKPNSINEFTQAIDNMFSDDKCSVTLSTVHRAKGLEEERVFILDHVNMPHPKAKSPWEREQENNIKYVALTRAKKELYLVD